MPLRDHFHPPLENRRPWEGFHGQWPAMMVIGLNRHLSQSYFAQPQVHLGSAMEIDVATFQEDDPDSPTADRGDNGGGLATAVWAPPRPILAVATDLPSEYEVRVFESRHGGRLVAVVELVSPSI